MATPAKSPRCFFASYALSRSTDGGKRCRDSGLRSLRGRVGRRFSTSGHSSLTVRVRRAVLSSGTCMFYSCLEVDVVVRSGMAKLATRPYSCCRLATSLSVGWAMAVGRRCIGSSVSKTGSVLPLV